MFALNSETDQVSSIDVNRGSANLRRHLVSGYLAIREARPLVQAIVILRFLAALVLLHAHGGVVHIRQAACALAGLSLVSVAVYLLNGVADLAGDIANGSTRPLARGALTLPFVRCTVAVTALVGQLFAFVAGPATEACVAVMLLVGIRYSCGRRPWKNTARGAACAVTCLGGSTYATAITVTPHARLGCLLMTAVVMTAWMGLVGAGAKDFADVAGDALTGRQVQPERGQACRRRVAVCSLLVAGMYLAAAANVACLRWSAAALLLAAIAVAALSWNCPLAGPRNVLRRSYRAFMAGQYGAHLLLLMSVG